MTAVTHDLRIAAATAKAAAPARPAKKGFWTRVYDAIVEARMRQVEREIRAHMHFVSDEVLKQAGFTRLVRDRKNLRFVK